MKNKNYILKVLGLIVFLIMISKTCVYGEDISDINYITAKAKVLEVGERQEIEEEFFTRYYQEVRVKVLSGEYKNEEFVIEHNLTDNEFYNINVDKDDLVMVSIEFEMDGSLIVNIIEFYRSDYIRIITIVFLLIVLCIGRAKGLRAVISLIATIILVVYVLLPGILAGKDPLLLSIGIAIVITIITIILISGLNRKSYSAIIGTSLGVIFAGFLSLYLGKKMNLTGMNSEEVAMLMFIPQDIEFNYLNLLFSGIILGALGAVMDVGMSIASSIEEVYNANTNISARDLFKSGMNIGTDVMGTMVNTLILAYTGSSIPMLILFMAYNIPLKEIINMDVIATEILRSLSGSIGLVLTIPITAAVSVFFIKNNKNNKNREEKIEDEDKNEKITIDDIYDNRI